MLSKTNENKKKGKKNEILKDSKRLYYGMDEERNFTKKNMKKSLRFLRILCIYFSSLYCRLPELYIIYCIYSMNEYIIHKLYIYIHTCVYYER